LSTILLLKILSDIGLSLKGFINGILLGWFIVLIGVVVFITSFDFSKLSSIESKTWAVLLPFTITTFLIAVFEEFLCRGILFNLFLKKWNNPKKAVIISSLIFGIAHITQLLSAPGRPFGTGISIILGFATGVFFAAIYLRSNNIWSVVLLHAIFDWLSNVPPILIQPVGKLADMSLGSAVINLALAAAFFLIGMFLKRKHVHLEVAQYTFLHP
jgi:membrane protease YdiL (CAAX protease family)